MKQRDLRRELGRALHVLDGLAELAVLVRDDAEQMLGFRHVRLRLEDLAADRLRLHQPALAAAALGVHQRFADRHERRLSIDSYVVHGDSDSVHARRRRALRSGAPPRVTFPQLLPEFFNRKPMICSC